MDRWRQFGESVFTTVIIDNACPYFLDYHLRRLQRHCDTVFGIGQFMASCLEDEIHLKVSSHKWGSMRVDLSKDKHGEITPTFTIRPPRERPTKVNLKVSESFFGKSTLNEKLKLPNYTEALLEVNKAVSSGFDDVLYHDFNGDICEATFANIFFIKGDKLITPELNGNILAGIVREVILKEGCLGDKSQERPVRLEELSQFDDAFITNSLIGVVPVQRIGKHEFDNQKSDELQVKFKKFMKDYHEQS